MHVRVRVCRRGVFREGFARAFKVEVDALEGVARCRDGVRDGLAARVLCRAGRVDGLLLVRGAFLAVEFRLESVNVADGRLPAFHGDDAVRFGNRCHELVGLGLVVVVEARDSLVNVSTARHEPRGGPQEVPRAVAHFKAVGHGAVHDDDRAAVVVEHDVVLV